MDNSVPAGTILDVYDNGHVVATVVVDEDGRAILQSQNLINGHTPAFGRIRLHVYDEFFLMGLAGFAFDLIDNRGNLVCELTTDAEGYALTGFIPFGAYSLRNTKADAPYCIHEEAIPVVLKSHIHVPLVEIVFG